jgi:iron complex transport system permease protein
VKIKITILFALILIFTLLDFSIGSISLNINDIFSFFTGQLSYDNPAYIIIKDLRLTRVLSAIVSGFSLAIAGTLMQSYFRNPLAGPYVLGISSGAGLGVAIFISLTHQINNLLNTNIITLGISGFSIIGTILFMIIIYILSLKLQNSLSLLIAGILLGTAANAVITFIQSISNGLQIQSYVFWTMGNLNNTQFNISLIILIIAIFSFIILLIYSKWFDLWLIGEEQAISTGLSKKAFTFITFSITTILIGLTTAFYGPIAFVGLISPHFARLLFKTQIHSKFITYSALIGTIIMLTSDIISQIFNYAYLPLNTITSFLAIPMLTYIFFKRKELWM